MDDGGEMGYIWDDIVGAAFEKNIAGSLSAEFKLFFCQAVIDLIDVHVVGSV